MTRKPKRSVADGGVLPDPVDVGVAAVVVMGLGVAAVAVASASLPPWGNGGGDMAAWELMPRVWRKPGDTSAA